MLPDRSKQASVAIYSVALLPTKFTLGNGAIEPGPRVVGVSKQMGNTITQAELDEFLSGLGLYVVPVDAQAGNAEKTIPSQCVDGRPRANGTYEPMPKAAAGTFSAVVGYALTDGSSRQKGVNAADYAREIYIYYGRHGYAVGGHDAVGHVPENGCGCGAEDNLASILDYIHVNGDKIRNFLSGTGIIIDNDTHDMIKQNAANLLDDGFVASGKQLREAYTATAGEDSVEHLSGPHNEVVLVINNTPAVTINRSALAASYENRLQAFVVDGWSMKVSAEALTPSVRESQQILTAMWYYNVATAAYLAGPTLRIAVC